MSDDELREIRKRAEAHSVEPEHTIILALLDEIESQKARADGYADEYREAMDCYPFSD